MAGQNDGEALRRAAAAAAKQFKALSIGDLEGLLCLKRHLAERYLGYRVESPAMLFGIAVHDIARRVNERRMQQGVESSPELIREMVAGDEELTLHQKAGREGAEVALLWWSERTHGTRPIDVEQHRFVDIGGRLWVFKPDAARLDLKGHLRMDDYKTGFTGDSEVARRNPRFMAYGLFGHKFYGVNEVHSDIWNLGQQFSIDLHWEADELERIEAYLIPEAEKIGRLHDRLMKTPEAEWPSLLDGTPEKFNDYCGSCPLGKLGKCATLKRFTLEGLLPEAESEAHRLEILRTGRRVLEALIGPVEDVLKGHVLEMGEVVTETKYDGRRFTFHKLWYGDREAIVKVEHHRLAGFKEKAELLKDVLERGKRSEMKARGRVWAVHTWEIGDGMIVTHKIEREKEKAVERGSRERQVQKLLVRGRGPCDVQVPAKPSIGSGGKAGLAAKPRASKAARRSAKSARRSRT